MAFKEKVDISVVGKLTAEEKQVLEAKAAAFGYRFARKGSILRLLRGIAKGEILLVSALPDKK